MTCCAPVSVLMPCLNPGAYLDEAIASALAQPELHELLIADGGSDGATLERLEAWAGLNRRVLWWSQADLGPADALNQAHKRATGDLIGWLNADDLYQPGALGRALALLEREPQWQMVYGHGQHIDAEGRFLELYPSHLPAEGITAFQDGCGICQPTVLLRRSFLEQIGGFDPQWRVCFDLDLWLRAFAAAPEAIGFVPALQASTRLHAGTITARQQGRVNLESAALLQRSLGDVAEHWLASAARELQGCPSDQRQLLASLLGSGSPLQERLVAQMGRLEKPAVAMEQIDQSLPVSLRLLLLSRPDLLRCGFQQTDQQRSFAQWLVLHGLREYPPFCSDVEVLHWLAAVPLGDALPRVSQAIWDSTERHQGRWTLPRRASSYQGWLKRHWQTLPQQPLPAWRCLFGSTRRQRLWERFVAPRFSVRRREERHEAGVHLIGYAHHALGIGEDLRTTAKALSQVGVSNTVVDFLPGDLQGSELDRPAQEIAEPVRHPASLICLTAEETMRYVLSEGRRYLKDRYVIGYWPWELPHWPAAWRPALELVDEIWVSSRYIQSALAAATSKPVRWMPLCVDADQLALTPLDQPQRRLLRQRFGLPEQAVVALCSFDLSSYSHRKNPWGALQAFQQAFPPALAGGQRNDVALVVKTFPPAQHHRDWERLKRMAVLDPRIHILEIKLERPELSELYGCCDVLLSLHRAEGFGRVLAEALQLGLDVIATDWSGNTDFMDGPLAHPVPYSLVPVPPGAYPHWQGQHWAEPELRAAAEQLQKVVERRLRDGCPPAEWVLHYRERFSATTCGQCYRQRLQELGLLSALLEPPGARPG
ncbi:MAG: glycosyltransferase [Synechococcus sp. WH 8007]|nr:glycosyltransferase [Synechococcus sp. WH 8007]